ncbi:hypothetical protein [Haloarcula sp. 1CSR25-25]|jgi:hypothetical protein|uniref:hypothetical protein n=1 Tax=Haloarcula sp. 1CSR25-25 TaxID=2862545 RepID=UPI002895DF5A|nr:hypothetical protein [Haloarcula sp. 1CSR25-25]MDT3437807.1 hypothetical protein [Haloarcula sp. 1CSR25-25]
MSSTPHSPQAGQTVLTSDQDLNTRSQSPPSVATFKDTLGYGVEDSIDSIEAVAKYVALQHPNFDLFPTLPSVFQVQFLGQALTRDSGQIVQKSEFEVRYGDRAVQQILGTVTIRREYDTLDAARRRSLIDEAVDATVEYRETPTP